MPSQLSQGHLRLPLCPHTWRKDSCFSQLFCPNSHATAWPAKPKDYISDENPGAKVVLVQDRYTEPDGIDLSQGSIRGVLQYWAKEKKDMAFATHAGTMAALLRACHQEDLNHDTHALAQSNLMHYVFLVSHASMVSRLRCRGKGDWSFFDMLTACYEQREKRASRDAESTKEKMVTPNPLQKAFIYRFMVEHGCSREISEEISLKPLNDQEGCWRMRDTLSDLLIGTAYHVSKIGEKVEELKKKDWDFDEKTERHELSLLLNRASGLSFRLSGFVKNFEEVLARRLEVLEEEVVAKEEDRKKREAGDTQCTSRERLHCDQSVHLAALRARDYEGRSKYGYEGMKYLHSICLIPTALDTAVGLPLDGKTALQKIESKLMREGKVVVLDHRWEFTEETDSEEERWWNTSGADSPSDDESE